MIYLHAVKETNRIGKIVESPSIVPRIRIKIALNVVKVWNLVQMKLLSCRLRTDSGAFRKFSKIRNVDNIAV